jgi:signal transduction histidine kinase
VAERTRRLERLQAVMLRAERTNTLAMLGAGLAHDLNNLLQTIGMSVELLRMEEAQGKRASRDTLDDIVTGTQEAGRLTQRLMSFARDEMASVERTPVDVHAVVSAHEDLLKMLLPRRISLHISLEAPGERLNLPPSLLEQALVNLVANARDAMPGSGVVKIRVRTEPNLFEPQLLIEVSDTGHGIDPAIQGSIFDSFFTTKAQHGTGIGLASVRAMMESVGGTVEVMSVPGHGATFTLAFPIERLGDTGTYAATGASAATAASSSPAE